MKENKKIINKIIVHGGVFHADDVMTVALAQVINPDIEIERVFAVPKDLPEDVIVADIGDGEYDHHQADAKLRPNGQKYAACGLFFDDFWNRIFQTEEFKKKFEEDYIIPIELNDNGVASNPLSKMISSYVPVWNDPTPMDFAFTSAVCVVRELIYNAQAEESAVIAAKAKIDASLEESTNDGVILNTFVPWQSYIVPTNKRFVIYPSRGQWTLQSVPVTYGSFQCRTPLPEQWLEQKPEGCTFVHTGLFLAAFTNREDAIQAANNL